MVKAFLYLLTSWPLLLLSQEFKPVDAPGAVQFYIRNFGSEVEGSFTGLAGTIIFDPAHPEKSKMAVTINASTIETGINMRNRHLRSEKYFHIEKFPRIRMESLKITAGNGSGQYLMKASLSIKGITQTVNFPFTARPEKDGFFFEGSFTINRRDFNVGSGSISLADEVRVVLKVMAKH
jgi:polyisoprenoid-binding protein YceI